MLRSLEIQNFKGIKQGKLEDLAQVNVLVGRNNSGKSTILDALLLMRYAIAKLDYARTDGLEQIIRRRINRNKDVLQEIHYMSSVENQITLQAGFPDGTGVTQKWHLMERGEFSTPWCQLFGQHGESLIPDSILETTGASSVENFYSNNWWWKPLVRSIGEANARFVALTHLLDANTIHSPFPEIFWEKIILHRDDKRLRELVNTVYKLDIEGIDLGPFAGHSRLVAKLPERSVAVDWLGDGFRYAVNILALGVLLKGTALLVEELETHQHPESLRKLTQTLLELAKHQDLQLFLTTHSMELITYALDAAEEKDISLKLHHLSLDKEGHLRATPFSQPNAQLMLDIGHDPRLHYKYIGVE